MKIARVFPRKTNASPTDPLSFFDGPGLFPPLVDKVHVSVTFDYDIEKAEWLAKQWLHIAPVKIGGPGVGQKGEEFIPGRYLKEGYTITSRGCPNSCWFCSVWKREGHEIRELEIKDGWNVLDDNLLACSEKHIREVFAMLKRQKRRAEFTGGLEAARLKYWHVDLLKSINSEQMFFAYDTKDDYEPLVEASKILKEAGFNRQKMRVYVLMGYPGDSIEKAEKRLKDTLLLGYLPMAMLYRLSDKKEYEWSRFQRLWARPALIGARFK